MPAFFTHEELSTNHLRDMLHQRVISQADDRNRIQEYTEIVIDELLLIPQIRDDPGRSIVAFLYAHTEDDANNAIAQEQAENMRDKFHHRRSNFEMRKQFD